MHHPSQITPNAFRTSARERLAEYVRRTGGDEAKIIALTPDASTREYFRVPLKSGAQAVVAVYPEPFDPEIHPFLDVTRLFSDARLPVPEILDVDPLNGIIVQEDFGDRQLRRVFESASEDEREVYLEQAVGLIADMQAATPLAFERNSIAARLAFDEAKLSWELDYFVEHYFKSLRGETLKHGDEAQLRAELNDVAAELANRPHTLCHRDFHPSNLMVDAKGRLRIIDYQDARMGPVSYDLVSLLLDRRTTMPSLAEVRERRLFFLEERRERGLEGVDPDDFAYEFRLMTVQRCLKAAGTFSYQTAIMGRGEVYAQFINPMLEIVVQAAEWLGRFPLLRSTLRQRLDGAELSTGRSNV
ncbi:MAG: N-acetylmuramate 1-kinase [Acidobacteriota bacterium]|jgi:aminoglycoside/choline kinase family phosphotransferase|nr:N-acetylmuramate 1-kinase [Acidobacteriota bacterium]MDT7807852.1 N-acetylmuramate 1-kinase [Acidobacteriota bacterium]